MKKRTFLKLSSALFSGTILSPLISCRQKEKQHNWAGNLEYSTDRLHEPKTVGEVQDLILRCSRLRALGTRHSFNRIADSTENLLSVRRLDQVLALDEGKQTVTVGAGMRYGELSQHFYSKGFALHNLASLPHISVAGACATRGRAERVHEANHLPKLRVRETPDAGHAPVGNTIANNGAELLVVVSPCQPREARAFPATAAGPVAPRAHSKEKLASLRQVTGVLCGKHHGSRRHESQTSRPSS